MTTVKIEHGTAKGYRQHGYYKVPSCEDCRAAIREEQRSQKAAKRTAQEWNRGRTGKPSAPRPVTVGRDCPAAGCGTPASEPRPAAGMVRVTVAGSRQPATWYCPGGCAAYGRALAEIRALEDGAAACTTD